MIELGQTVITANAQSQLDMRDVLVALARHVKGDWGDVCEEDRELNNIAVREGCRVLSVYYSHGTKFWIITEADRSYTTVLLPEDY